MDGRGGGTAMAPKRPWAQRTGVDAKVMQRTGLDEMTLLRLRRDFHQRVGVLIYAEKHKLATSGTAPRFKFMHTTMQDILTTDQQAAWQAHIEHSTRDLDDMCRGEYPISPYILRVYSALFGIKVDYLLLGSKPVVDPIGASIEIWPMAADAK